LTGVLSAGLPLFGYYDIASHINVAAIRVQDCLLPIRSNTEKSITTSHIFWNTTGRPEGWCGPALTASSNFR